MAQTTRFIRISTLALLLALPAVSEAGPPLICHPFQAAGEALLPWGDGSSWNTPDGRYDVQQLTGDTLRLLSRGQPVLARMENLRRATIYAGKDARIANELLSAVLARALATAATGAPDADALFDAGYLIESYKQAGHLHRNSLLAGASAGRWTLRNEPGGDGYAMVNRAIASSAGNAEMHFAASLMTTGAVSAEHRRLAATRAAAGSALAWTIAQTKD